MADIAEIDIYTTEFGMAIVGFLLALFAILTTRSSNSHGGTSEYLKTVGCVI
jgi:hypothetical protein